MKEFEHAYIIVEDDFQNIYETSSYYWKIKNKRRAMAITMNSVMSIQTNDGIPVIFVGEDGGAMFVRSLIKYLEK